MENFDPKPQGVKEKNFYILHLDTPRIIILTSVLVGIITAAFLFGMGIVKSDKPVSKELTLSDMDLGDSKSGDIFGKDIPPIPGESAEDGAAIDDKISLVEENSADHAALAEENRGARPPAKDETKLAKSDVFKNENIKEIIPPADNTRKIEKEHKTAKSDTGKRIDNKKIALHTEMKKNEKPRNKSRIYEVSRETEKVRSYDSYSVQVASYDTMAKAEREKDLLRSKRFDAYIAKSVVSGKNYFRVRIGPVGSSKRAQELLEDVQRDSRYASSYMVKE